MLPRCSESRYLVYALRALCLEVEINAEDKRPVQGVSDAPGPDSDRRVLALKQQPDAKYEVPHAEEAPQVGTITHASIIAPPPFLWTGLSPYPLLT